MMGSPSPATFGEGFVVDVGATAHVGLTRSSPTVVRCLAVRWNATVGGGRRKPLLRGVPAGPVPWLRGVGCCRRVIECRATHSRRGPHRLYQVP